MKNKPSKGDRPVRRQSDSKVLPDPIARTSRTHLRFGWWALLFFLSLGIFLELLHGFKAGLYLDVGYSTRRLMWTLAHAHGTLLSLVNIAFAFTVTMLPAWKPKSRNLASVCLYGATILMSSGFFLGGLYFYSGDPGIGIFLLPRSTREHQPRGPGPLPRSYSSRSRCR